MSTKLTNLINPEVMADMVSAKLDSAMRFAPLCAIDRTLAGRAGDTVVLPKYAYIGDAADVSEGSPITINTLAASSEPVQVKKAGNGVELTDEAVLSGYGDPVSEAANQLALSIANKLDSDVLTALSSIGSSMTADASSAVISADAIADALVKFGDELDGEKAIFIAPAQLATLRKSEAWVKATDIGADTLIKGTVGMIHGCQVILSNKIVAEGTTTQTYTNYIIKSGAVGIYLKRDTEIEKDRNITTKTTVITADKHYAVHLKDESKAIKLTCKA